MPAGGHAWPRRNLAGDDVVDGVGLQGSRF
jgi:hypothetical protein